MPRTFWYGMLLFFCVCNHVVHAYMHTVVVLHARKRNAIVGVMTL